MTIDRRETEAAVTLKALQSDYCPSLIQQARTRQDALLKQRYRGQRLRIADIGCGEGPHGSMFAADCEAYHGFEISPMIARVAEKRWRSEGLSNATLFVGDVAQAKLTPPDTLTH